MKLYIHARAIAVLSAFAILAQASPEDAPCLGDHEETQHQIPTAAWKAYQKGRSATARGNPIEALKCFREAVTLDPEFAAAYNDLGAIYLARGDLSPAAEQFQSALAVAPMHRLALANLAVTLIRMNRYREAGEAARRALAIDPGNAGLHLVLAASLLAQPGGATEAMDHLERASAEIPRAHLLAAEVLLKAGRREEAMYHLEEYLLVAAPRDRGRAGAEAQLAQLRRGQPH
jgi:tetratricopeptide (TPR) repeat protein